MKRHPIDLVSAVFALLALAAGTIVTFDLDEGVGDHLAVWLGVGALLVGLSLLPWGRRPAD